MAEQDEIREELRKKAEQIENEILSVIGPLFNRLGTEQPVHQDQVEAVGAFFGMAVAMAAHFRGQLDDGFFNEIRRQYGEPSAKHDAVIERMVREREDLSDEERWLLMNRDIGHSKSFAEFEARHTGDYIRWIFGDLNVLHRRQHAG